jgi:hypothetical protein
MAENNPMLQPLESASWDQINLNFFDIGVEIYCENPEISQLIHKQYSALIDKTPTDPTLTYQVGINHSNNNFFITRNGSSLIDSISDDGYLLFYLEKDLTIQFQYIKPNLFFIHGAALEFNDQACLLVAPSGSGKSTTTWGMLHHGFNYISDELAPIELQTMHVSPYPHALCMKRNPPLPYTLPEGTLFTSRTIHVPVELLPSKTIRDKKPLTSIFFVQYSPDAVAPSARPVSGAEAGARVYSNALNLAAHPRHGLDAAINIGAHCKCFELTTNNLEKTADLIKSTLQS